MSEGNVPEPRAFDNAPEAPADVVEAVASAAPWRPNVFAKLYAGGYTRLVPVLPCDAQVREKSSLNRPKSRGKAVGVRGRDGLWHGFDWVRHESSEHDVERWHAMEADIGIKGGLMPDGNTLVFIDADTKNPEHAATVEKRVRILTPKIPKRIGQAPKAAYPVRVAGAYPYTRIEFGDRDEQSRLTCRVEILGEARYLKVHGIHPDTGKSYTWPVPLCCYEDLPIVTAEQLDQLLRDLAAVLPAASDLKREGAGVAANDVDQDSLRGDPEVVAKLVRATPNTTAAFPTRESYVHFGYAIKASMPDDEPAAFALFSDWCDRWEGGNDPAVVASDWRRMPAPYKRGFAYLKREATRASGGAVNDATLYFDAAAAAAQPEAPALVATAAMAAPSVWISPTSWEGQVIKPREWEVENWIPRRQVTLLYGDGGIGKTLLAQQLATSMAAGIPWLGQVTRPGRVLCVFCEDDPDELQRRQSAINRALGLTNADLANVLITSRTHEDNVLATWGRDGRMELRPLWYEIRDRALAFRADTIILDPLSDIYAGSEIDRGQVTTFVKGGLGRLAHEIGGSVVALAHPSQSGMSSGQGTSGSSAWSNAVRSRLYLSSLGGNARELVNMKLNYGPKGSKLKLEYHQGAFRVTSGAMPAGVPDGAGLIPKIEDAAETAVARALIACRGEQMHPGTTSKFNATKLFRTQVPETLTGFTDPEVTAALSRMMGRGDVQSATLAKDSHGRPRPTLVLMDKMSATAADAKGRDSSSE